MSSFTSGGTGPVIRSADAETAPDFCLADTRGAAVRLSDHRGRRHVVLVLLRGFG